MVPLGSWPVKANEHTGQSDLRGKPMRGWMLQKRITTVPKPRSASRLAPAPELLAPVGETAGLPGEVRVEMSHELRESVGGLDTEQEVEVVAREGEGADFNRVELL